MFACDEVITLIKCDGEDYSTFEIKGVSWYDKVQIGLVGNGFASANTTKIRIPASVIGAGFVMPSAGDHIVRGCVTTPIERPADMKPYNPRRVMRVGDNRRGGLPHIVVTCE